MATIYVATTGNDSTGTGAIGAPYATPGKAASVMAAGDTIDISAGTYVMTTASTNVAGGCISDIRNSSGLINKWIGHGTVIFQAGVGVTSVDLFFTNANRLYIENIIIDGDNKSLVNGFNINGNYTIAYGCTAKNCKYGYHVYGDNYLYKCLANNNSSSGFKTESGYFFWCVARNNSGDGFYSSKNYESFENCVSYSNGGWGFTGNYNSLGQFIRQCIAYGNSSGGFNNSGWSNGRMYLYDSCIAYGNTGYGFVGDGTNLCINCAAGSNTSGGFSAIGIQNNSITLTADPFNSASTGDFNLNTTAGGGALLGPSAANFVLPW